jgi:hypothetical protein
METFVVIMGTQGDNGPLHKSSKTHAAFAL